MKLKTLLLLITSTLLFAGAHAQAVKNVTSAAAMQLIKKETQLVILDVRTPREFAEGHIKNAININIQEPDGFDHVAKLDKNAKYLVYCRTQNRSTKTADFMLKSGYKNLYKITDGFTGWLQNEFEVEK